MDLLKDSIKKLYFRYLFPSMGSAVVASVYLMTDAVVIGKGISDNALAALNMTTPIISLMFSIGILFGIGGSVLFSVHKGTGDDENEEFVSIDDEELLNKVFELFKAQYDGYMKFE